MTRGPIEQDRVAIELGLVPRPEGYVPPRYKRNRTGSVAHHYDCPRAANGHAWFWPESLGFKADGPLLSAMPWWIKPCKICFAEALDGA